METEHGYMAGKQMQKSKYCKRIVNPSHQPTDEFGSMIFRKSLHLRGRPGRHFFGLERDNSINYNWSLDLPFSYHLHETRSFSQSEISLAARLGNSRSACIRASMRPTSGSPVGGAKRMDSKRWWFRVLKALEMLRCYEAR